MTIGNPVSDSYDPEFSTEANAEDVRALLKEARDIITDRLGEDLHYIVNVAQGKEGKTFLMRWSERHLRGVRFAIDRALESI